MGSIGKWLVRWVPVMLPFVVVGVFVARGFATPDFPNLVAPAGVTLPPTTSTQPAADLAGVQLPGVEGTTTSSALRTTGTARLAGVVNGPNGPVDGATVRVQRIGTSHTTDTVAGSDGRWGVGNLSGGRYRVWAFLPPTLADAEPKVIFLADGEQQSLTLNVDRYTGLTISSNNAPDPPVVGASTTLVVRVVSRGVSGGGDVRSAPAAGATVTITKADGFTISGAASTTTGGSGDATFTIVCTTPGANRLDVTVRVDPAGTDQGFGVTTSACVSPPPPPPPPPPPTSSSSPSSSSPSSSSSPN